MGEVCAGEVLAGEFGADFGGEACCFIWDGRHAVKRISFGIPVKLWRLWSVPFGCGGGLGWCMGTARVTPCELEPVILELVRAEKVARGGADSEFARRCGLPRSTVVQALAGDRPLYVTRLYAFAQALGVAVSVLLVAAERGETSLSGGPASATSSSASARPSSVGVRGSVDVVFTSRGRAVVPPSESGGVFGLAAKDVGYGADEELEERARNQP